MKRLRRDYKKRFVSAAMAASMLATMLPFSAVAYAVGEDNSSETKDISITWGEPEMSDDGTTGSVKLSASLNDESIKSATVNITLTAEEAAALTNEAELEKAGITLKAPEPEEPTPEPESEPEEEIGGETGGNDQQPDGTTGDGSNSTTDNNSPTDDTTNTGGEQQRIAIARVMLKNTPIIILDEATAFADPDNETRVQAAFSRLARGKTVLMVAHRLSTVAGADTIYVVEDGRIVQSGSSRELLEQDGLFRRMWQDYQTSVQWKVQKEAR